MNTTKILSVLFLTMVFGIGSAQEKYLDKNGVIIFEASEKLFEEVKAVNESVTAIYNANTDEIASLALMQGFRFKNSLMQEHFNENYIESDSYPKATFRGKLLNLDKNLTVGSKTTVTVKGTLSLHGVSKEIETELDLTKLDDTTLHIKGQFVVTPQDFQIEIPKIVRNKIAKEVQVQLEFKLQKK